MYVNDVDLSKHCKPCLKGYTSKKITKWTRHEENVCLDESEAKYYYLCGGSYPYKWENNFHLAWKEKSGASFEYYFNGITIRLKNTERIEFSQDDVDLSQEYADRPEYYTCRNWQFANKISKKYPMTYKEFEEKVVSLYLDSLNDEQLEMFVPLLDEELKKKPCFIQTIYGQICFDYDNPDIYGEIVKHSFEDEFLKRNAVSQLENFLG
nr:hypothetical protein [uncultured Methanobrevibacter sp.]